MNTVRSVATWWLKPLRICALPFVDSAEKTYIPCEYALKVVDRSVVLNHGRKHGQHGHRCDGRSDSARRRRRIGCSTIDH